jgi:hypothetical protein
MGFIVGKSSVEPSTASSLKLHLLRLEMQPLYQDLKICDLALQTERGQCLNYSYIVIIQLFSIIYCIGSRCRRVAVLNRQVSINHLEKLHGHEKENSGQYILKSKIMTFSLRTYCLFFSDSVYRVYKKSRHF